MSGRGTTALVLAGLALAVAAVFGQTVSFPFLAFDDDVYVTANPRVAAGLQGGNLGWALAGTGAGYWHPLTWLSLMADASLYGEWAGGFHLTALLLHLLAASALFLALRSLTGAAWPSALAAGLFALHPLHVESVAWVSQRKDLLFALFWFLGMAAYAAYARRPGAARYLAVMGCFLLGGMAKPMVVTFPFALLLLDAWPLGRFRPRAGERRWAPALRLAAEKLPLLLLSLALVAVSYRAQLGYGAIRGEEGQAGTRLANALVSYWAYLRDALWPSSLAVYYPFPEQGVPLAAWGSAALGLAAATALLWALRKGRPWLLVGWLWFLGTLVPALGIIPLGSYARADRFTYVPLVGVFLALAWEAGRAAERGARARAAVTAAALATLLAAGVASFQQVRTFRDGVTLFTRALERGGESFVALANLGHAHLAEGRAAEAEGPLRRALALVPEDVPARLDLARALQGQGREEEARGEMEKVLQRAPHQPDLHLEYARLLAAQGNGEAAVAAFRDALLAGAEGWEVRDQLGVELGRLGRHDEARAEFAEAARLAPGEAGPRYNLAVSLRHLGREAEAEEALKEARRLDRSLPTSPPEGER